MKEIVSKFDRQEVTNSFSILSNMQNEVIAKEPDHFKDLNLDQVVNEITSRKEEYQLKAFFYSPLHDINTIEYRHEVFRDLENPALLGIVLAFSRKMRDMREHLTQIDKLSYQLQKQSWFLDAVEIYSIALKDTLQELSQIETRSRGFIACREYLEHYTESEEFTSLFSLTQQIKLDLSTVKYAMIIKDNTIRVCHYEEEIDYSAEIEQMFEKFKQGAVQDHKANPSDWRKMNHVEAKVLEFVSMLFPDIFAKLEEFYLSNQDYVDETIAAFDREIQFYIAYLEYMENFARKGLTFCYPQMTNTDKHVQNYGGFDLALASKFRRENDSIIVNDFFLNKEERIIVVSGPNQGGKTTFARTFGQLSYLSSLGCPVPGKKARFFLFDHIFTHFEKEEKITNLKGKLEDDLYRMAEILQEATPDSIIILNEIFTSTTLTDAIFLGKQVLGKINELDLLCVCVTFMDELSHFSEKTISMVSTVVPENHAQRTFKVVRRPADGLSYALSIAEKYSLTYQTLKERLV